MDTDNKILHAAIFGQTTFGKSYFAKQQAEGFRRRGMRVIVCDPMLDPEWPADFITDDIDELVEVAKLNSKCAIFIDEGEDTIGMHPKKHVRWLTSQSRHRGHITRILAQRPKDMVSKTMRTQLNELFLFNVDVEDAKEMARSYNEEALKEAYKLPRYQFFYKKKGPAPAKLCILDV